MRKSKSEEEEEEKESLRGSFIQVKLAVGFLLDGGAGREVVLEVGAIQVQFGA